MVETAMKRFGQLLSLAIVVGLWASPAHASISLTLDSYDVDGLDSDPGLVIETAKLLPQPYSFDLEVGESITVELFDIWTNESAHNLDDSVQKPISVDFLFSEPAPAFGGSVDGGTSAATGTIIVIPFSAGLVEWDGVSQLFFGPNGDGILEVTLFDEYFNGSLIGGFDPGRENGATINAEFKLLAEPTAVPEMSSIIVWSFIGLGVGLVAYRRQCSAA